ncbi:MAG: hypothetical protein KH135_02760 [Firmicutes bacterium]|nr:hypothetical protein [Bacillota bacterium]
MTLSISMIFIIISVIVIFMLNYIRVIDTKKFIHDTEPYLRFLMEDDYEFLLNVRYGDDVDVNVLFSKRVQTAIITVGAMFILFITNLSFINIMIIFIVAGVMFKFPYMKLKSYYNANLYQINLMLPYYLKSLEILVQHYTVPVALARSIETAPDIFKSGLKDLVDKVNMGDSSVNPYMDFAKQYPVRDSMRMMRLLYRLGLGSQENKQEQLMMFSKTVSQLQNKAREQKYKDRLEKMEKKTMMMLCCTGGGIIFLLLLSMTQMMGL